MKRFQQKIDVTQHGQRRRAT